MSSFWSPLVHQLSPYVPGEQDPNVRIKLNTNENPYPPSPAVQTLLRNFDAEELKRYPSADSLALREGIANTYKVDADQVFVGNGSDEVLAHAFVAFFKQQKAVLYPDISYSFYPVYFQLFGISAQAIPLADDFSINPADYEQENGGIIITNPNAPTTLDMGLSAIESVLKANPDSVVMIDEAYVDYGAQSAISLVKQYPNLLVIHTFSKSRSLAGLRVGFAIGHADLIAGLVRVKDSFNSYPVNRISHDCALQALTDTAYFEQCNAKIIATRQHTIASLQSLGFECLDSATNFIFCTHPKADAESVYLALKKQGILVRYFNQAKIDQHLRITVGTDEEMQHLLTALSAIV